MTDDAIKDATVTVDAIKDAAVTDDAIKDAAMTVDATKGAAVTDDAVKNALVHLVQHAGSFSTSHIIYTELGAVRKRRKGNTPFQSANACSVYSKCSETCSNQSYRILSPWPMRLADSSDGMLTRALSFNTNNQIIAQSFIWVQTRATTSSSSKNDPNTRKVAILLFIMHFRFDAICVGSGASDLEESKGG